MEANNIPSHPENGETVLHCGHTTSQYKFLLFVPQGIRFRSSQGEKISRWVSICNQCKTEIGDDFNKIKIRGTGVWQNAKHQTN